MHKVNWRAEIDALYDEGCDAANTQLDHAGLGFVETDKDLDKQLRDAFWRGYHDTLEDSQEEVALINHNMVTV